MIFLKGELFHLGHGKAWMLTQPDPSSKIGPLPPWAATGKAEEREKVVAPLIFLRNGHLSTSGCPKRFCGDTDSLRKLPKNISILATANSDAH
jgi:hypothetical protein